MDQISALFTKWYLEENPYRLWLWILTPLLLMWIPPKTRRFGAIGFFVILFCMGAYFVIMAMFKQYTPDDTPKSPTTSREDYIKMRQQRR